MESREEAEAHAEVLREGGGEEAEAAHTTC